MRFKLLKAQATGEAVLADIEKIVYCIKYKDGVLIKFSSGEYQRLDSATLPEIHKQLARIK